MYLNSIIYIELKTLHNTKQSNNLIKPINSDLERKRRPRTTTIA